MPPTAPINEGSSQFVYQLDDAFYLVDYDANTVSVWEENKQEFLNKLGDLHEFLVQLKQSLQEAYIQQLVAANPMPVPTDYFGNSDETLSALNA
jgi:hypothetical protein